MKTLSINKVFAAIILAIGFLFTSCEKEPMTSFDAPVEQPKLNLLQVQTTPQGILRFTSQQDMNDAISALARTNSDVRSDWENSHNFTSLQARVSALKENGTNYQDHLIQSALTSGMIRITTLSDRTIIEPNLFNNAFSYVVNEHGFVLINNDLIQVTATSIKLMQHADLNRISQLHAAEQNDPTLDIFVTNVSQALRNTTFWMDNCSIDLGGEMLSTRGVFSSVVLGPADRTSYVFNNYTLTFNAKGPVSINVKGESLTTSEITNGSETVVNQVNADYFEQFSFDEQYILPCDENGLMAAQQGWSFTGPMQLVRNYFEIFVPAVRAGCSVSY